MKYNSFSFVIHTTTLRVLKKSLPNFLSILVILLVVSAAFQVLICSSYTMKWDMMNQFLPCRYFISECLHHHILPLWCPYINFGYPFYADPQSGIFYPITWLIALTAGYSVYTIGLEYVLHIAIAGVAFFYLLKNFDADNYTATVFGIVYCLSGVFISNAQHLPWIITLAWLPLILLNFKNLFDKPGLKSALALSLFLYLGITGGYPGFFIILFYFFLVYGIIQIAGNIQKKEAARIGRVIIFFALSGAIFAVISGGYLYSFTGALAYIARGKPVSITEANNVALTPRAMVSFFSPFATACASFRTDTDISMANIYCGFLLLPLVFIALVKVRLQYFHKAVFALAVICLLAAAGKYFFVRSWLYNFLPGMNMLRHAAIFRVFTMFGLVFVSATGFGWFINSVKANTHINIIKTIFIAYAVLLLAVFSASCIKSGFNLHLPSVFNTNSIADFNARQNVYAHITYQLAIQLGLLLIFIAVLFIKPLPVNAKVILLSSIIIADIFFSTELNLPATVISDVKPAELQAKLDKLSTGFPIPPLKPVGSFTHYSDGSTLPIWYNISFFKKIPAKDGFNSFYLQSVDDLNASSRLDSFLNRPVVFFKDAGTGFEIKKFEPGNVEVHYRSNTADVISLQQNFYAGWNVFIDGKKEVPQHELCYMNSPVPSGDHVVRFEYNKKQVKYLLLLSALMLILIIGFLTGTKHSIGVHGGNKNTLA